MHRWKGLSTLQRGRLAVMLAAILWSTSGAFVKTLQLPDKTFAVYRAGIAGASLLLVVAATRTKVTFDVRMIGMVASFALMNYWFMASMVRTTAANAIFLQYSAPVWMFLASVFLLREKPQPRTASALVVAVIGLAVLLAGEWNQSTALTSGVVYGLLSGVGFAAVAVFLRTLRGHHPLWLASLNMLCAAALAMAAFSQSSDPGSWKAIWPPPTEKTLVALVIFSVTQLALPYVLFGWGLKHVSPQEAGLLALFEPVLIPVWTYLVAGEIPAASTIIGGAILVAALVWQAWPRNDENPT
jgi:drug/metabolite transporter, DME family